jgi:hypothetical protein
VKEIRVAVEYLDKREKYKTQHKLQPTLTSFTMADADFSGDALIFSLVNRRKRQI